MTEQTPATTDTAKVRTMSLPVKLTEDEVALRAQELASAENVLGEHERRLTAFVESSKGTKKQIESEISEARETVSILARSVRDRSERREVPIVEALDFERGAVNTVRTDTGEIVTTRGMTEQERQRSLFEAKNKGAKKGAGASAES